MSLTILGIVLVVVFLVSMTLTRWLSQILQQKGLIDVPNQRSSHTIPTPRGGGIAIIKGLLVGLVLLYLLTDISLPGLYFWIGLFLIALTGFLDDRTDLPVYIRFLLQLAAAILIFFETQGFESFPLPDPYTFPLGFLNYPLTVFWIIAVINIFNFLDGIDGFAGMQTVLAGLAMAMLDWQSPVSIIGLLIAFAGLGFLRYNWAPARIFMGDIGSATLGYIFATLPFYMTEASKDLGIFAMGIFLWFFLSDGAVTIIRRLLKGEKIWEAHRTHLYQQLTTVGMSHAQVVSRVMAASLLLIIIFFGFYFILKKWLILMLPIAIFFYIAYFMYVEKKKKTQTL